MNIHGRPLMSVIDSAGQARIFTPASLHASFDRRLQTEAMMILGPSLDIDRDVLLTHGECAPNVVHAEKVVEVRADVKIPSMRTGFHEALGVRGSANGW